MFYNPELNKYGFCFKKGYLVDDCRYYKNQNYEHFKKAYIEYYSFTKPSSLLKRRFYLASQARYNSKSPKSLYICLYKRYTIAQATKNAMALIVPDQAKQYIDLGATKHFISYQQDLSHFKR